LVIGKWSSNLNTSSNEEYLDPEDFDDDDYELMTSKKSTKKVTGRRRILIDEKRSII
jgi:hypothetical protein